MNMKKETIRITRCNSSNHYDSCNLGLIIPKDKEGPHLVTITVSSYRYKCVSISREDALGVLTAMRQEQLNANS